MFSNDLLTEHAALFEHYRPRLSRVASRLLGSSDDAEDLVQETSLRWLKADPSTIRAPEGWLVAAVRRLSIDWLRRAATEQRYYASAVLWGPGATSEGAVSRRSPEDTRRLAAAFQVLLERLAPTERIVFALREVLDSDYEEIARVLQRSQAACRQIVHRARKRVRQGRSQLTAASSATQRLVDQCLGALASGDREALLAMLATEETPVAQMQGKSQMTAVKVRPNQDLDANLPRRAQVAAA